jgi:anti-anti-sigma factor
MELVVEDLPDGVTRAALVGRMDIDGALSVDEQFRGLASLKRAIVVDLAELTFMASMGLRTMVVAARSLNKTGGRMVFANAQNNVERVLETSGLGAMIGLYPSVETAVKALKG